MSTRLARLQQALLARAGLRRVLLWSFLAVIGSGAALIAVAFVGEGAALAARRDGHAGPDLTLAVYLLVTVFYAGLAVFLAACCIGAWKLWKARGGRPTSGT